MAGARGNLKRLRGSLSTGTIRTTVLTGKDVKIRRVRSNVKVEGLFDEVLGELESDPCQTTIEGDTP